MVRRLRIAAAVVFALLAVGFVALWVRSYYYSEGIAGPIGKYHSAGVDHCCGLIKGNLSRWPERTNPFDRWQRVRYYAARDREAFENWRSQTVLDLGFFLHLRPVGGFGFSLPHWFLAASSLALSALLAFKPITRFTVRGLLIVTTLLAAMLGLVVYAV